MTKKETHLDWLKSMVNFDGPDCLLWPWAKDGQGRGSVKYGDKLCRAHRVMCEMVHGAPPTLEHHAAHSCGNGHLACVHPKHVSWKTKEENAQDRVKDGRNFGNSAGHFTKFTPHDLVRLKDGIRAKRRVKDLAVEFGVARSVVNYWDRKLRRENAQHTANKGTE